MKNLLTINIVTAFIMLILSASAFAKSEIYTGTFSDLAVSGYDTVAYFTENHPVKGSKEFSTKWKGAEWRFSSQKNLDMFTANKTKYAPQYGGYCAYAASAGGTASADPNQWTVYNDKLYLNYNKRVQEDWLKDKDGYISKADGHWSALLK